MAAAVVPLLDGHLRGGALSIPMDSDPELIKQLQEKQIEVMEGAKDNLPDEKSLKAAGMIKNLVSNLQHDSILLVLVSGKL